MTSPNLTFEICILAGGESSRMGANKARVRIGRWTMLGLIRQEAGKVGVRVRIIRRDLVERCGPLGGILTGLKTTRCEAVLFLACDMPLITATFIKRVISQLGEGTGAVFTQSKGAGFPFVLKKEILPIVEQQISVGEYSIHGLCKKLAAEILQPAPAQMEQLFNVNTPEDLERVRQLLLAAAAPRER